MDINVKAAFLYCREVTKIMIKQGYGNIINTSSMVSLYGQPRGVGYPTSKFTISGMTKSLTRELGEYNIRVNTVASGVTNTNLLLQCFKSIVKKTPLGRIGEPEEVVNVFLFLVSDLSSYVSGVIISIVEQI